MKSLKCRNFVTGVRVAGFNACLALAACCLSACSRSDSENANLPRKSQRSRRATPIPIVQHPASKQQTAIAQSIVQQQLRAFRDNDYQKALDLLAPIMKGAQTPQQLRAMIQAQYPEFAQVARIQWLTTRASPDGALSTNLRFMTRSGSVVSVFYSLSLQNNRYLITTIQPQMLSRSLGDTASPYSENSTLEEFFRGSNQSS